MQDLEGESMYKTSHVLACISVYSYFDIDLDFIFIKHIFYLVTPFFTAMVHVDI